MGESIFLLSSKRRGSGIKIDFSAQHQSVEQQRWRVMLTLMCFPLRPITKASSTSQSTSFSRQKMKQIQHKKHHNCAPVTNYTPIFGLFTNDNVKLLKLRRPAATLRSTTSENLLFLDCNWSKTLQYCRSHDPLALASLHWLPVSCRIDFAMLFLT